MAEEQSLILCVETTTQCLLLSNMFLLDTENPFRLHNRHSTRLCALSSVFVLAWHFSSICDFFSTQITACGIPGYQVVRDIQGHLYSTSNFSCQIPTCRIPGYQIVRDLHGHCNTICFFFLSP